MASLLGIPRELRDNIIELVLLFTHTPLDYPGAALQHRVPLIDIDYRSWEYGPCNNLYEKQDFVPTSLPLLLVNRQLYAETRAALQRLPEGHSYLLDVMLVDEAELWPTWLSVPVLVDRVDSVLAKFRIFGNQQNDYHSVLDPGDASPLQLVWCFYCLLERFLRRGPVGQRRMRLADRNITIKTLTLDFLSPSDSTMRLRSTNEYRQWLKSRSKLRGLWEQPDGNNSVVPSDMHPEWLMDFVSDYICMLLGMDYHMELYGKILYERVGVIRVCVDGKLETEYNLAEMLAKLRFDRHENTSGYACPYESVHYLREWKKKALNKRREAGLPAPDPEVKDIV